MVQAWTPRQGPYKNPPMCLARYQQSRSNIGSSLRACSGLRHFSHKRRNCPIDQLQKLGFRGVYFTLHTNVHTISLHDKQLLVNWGYVDITCNHQSQEIRIWWVWVGIWLVWIVESCRVPNASSPFSECHGNNFISNSCHHHLHTWIFLKIWLWVKLGNSKDGF